jgi:pimeloyl-ACP methyl ester carboxylesterase
LLCCAAGAGAASPPAPTLIGPHRCPHDTRFTCSTLAVPLDHRGRAGGRLGLKVGVQTRGGSRGILLFLTGGPGQPGVPSVTRVLERLGPAVAGYRLVMLDQRGTGAGALRCPALQRQMGASDLAVPTAASVRSCARAIGPRRRYFSTEQTVGDLETLRRALGVAKLAIDGVSYGSFVAERYALAHPSRVSRLVLDSVVPQTGVDPLGVANLHAVARVLRAACAASDCPSDPARDLATVVRRWRQGPALLDTLVTMSIFDPKFIGLPAVLHAGASGDIGPIDRLLAQWRPTMISVRDFSQGLHASALCADLPLPWPSAVTALAKRQSALRRAASRVSTARLWPFDRATAVGNGVAVTCSLWSPTGVRAADTQAIHAPALILAGGRDLSTPLEWARAQAALTPRARLVVVPAAGHSVQMRARNDAGRRAVAAFLRGR